MRELTVGIGSIRLDDGTLLHDVQQRVTIYGSPSPANDNVVLVTHALTGSSRAAEWWPGIVGHGALFDPSEWCIVGINVLGGCYGSTGAPRVSVGDMVRAQALALSELEIERLAYVIGGSLGGMQALSWALDFPHRVENAIVVGAHDHHSAMGIALNALQRECLELDPVRGLRTARKLAMLTYKSEELFNERHDRRPDRNDPSRFDIEGYLDLQADRFIGRMDASTYATLTHAMDSFDVRGRHLRGSLVTFVGITSDRLFRPQDVRAAARAFGASYIEFDTHHGHDAFLAESSRLASLLTATTEPRTYSRAP
ncbi:MAG: alpha/beta fold hydrolase [Candidatus Eremiobacteraeota bacterium]|nr:alpha/beta fold hydrolase [Candidatus Eremiobacteraeota bacterium]